jgi:DNA mismatch repair protein MutL
MFRYSSENQNELQSAYTLTSLESIIREMIENSLDSNSNYLDIHVEIQDIIKIKFSDNGDGIPFDVMNSLSERYISTKDFNEDSGKIKTFGFRGEALCSIISISDTVKIYSSHGYVEYKNGKLIESNDQRKIEKGSLFFIEDPFCKVPIRKKVILSSIFKVMGRITSLVSEYYIFNDVEIRLNLNSIGKERSHIFPLFPSMTKKLNIIHPSCQFEPLTSSLDSCEISYVFGNSDYRYVAINSRPAFWKKLNVLLRRMEENLNKKIVVFNVTITSGFDLNVEPDKRIPFIVEEVKILKDIANFFSNFSSDSKTFNPTTSVEPNSGFSGASEKPVQILEDKSLRVPEIVKKMKVSEECPLKDEKPRSIHKDDGTESLETKIDCNLGGFEPEKKSPEFQNIKAVCDFTFSIKDFEPFEIIGNFNRSFILIKIKHQKVFIIDQHAADERINLELLENNFLPDMQPLLHPMKFSIEYHLEGIAIEYKDDIEKLFGFKYSVQNGEITLYKAPKVADEILKSNHLLEIFQDIKLTNRSTLRSSTHLCSFLATKA